MTKTETLRRIDPKHKLNHDLPLYILRLLAESRGLNPGAVKRAAAREREREMERKTHRAFHREAKRLGRKLTGLEMSSIACRYY